NRKRETLTLRLRSQRAPLFGIRIRFELGLGVEDHRAAALGGEWPPLRQAPVIRIAVLGEGEPRIRDSASEIASVRGSAGHRGTSVGVVEDKWKLGTMKRG